MKKRHLLLGLFALLGWTQARADVEINETNFPDENFRSFLLKGYYGSDGVFTDEEIAGITNMAIVGWNISSLKGIEFFTALTKLNCDRNQLTSLDVSGCKALTSLSCIKNQLTTLNVSGCTALTNLSCYINQLTTLDVSGCYALKVLRCYSNQIRGTAMSALIESLPRTVNENELYVIYSENEGNVMTTTQAAVAKAKGRTPLYFDSTQNKWLEYAGSAPSGDAAAGVEINETNFPDENFRKYLLLMDGSDGVFTDEEIAGITSITVPGSSIASLKGIEFFTALTYLYCTNNQLTALDVSKNTALKLLRCANNQLTALDVSKNTALISLECYDNQLTALDVSKNTALTSLQCYDNQLTSLDITKNTALARLYCSNNQLTSLDVSKNTALTRLLCANNQLTSLNVQSTALLGLDCSNNKLTSLIVSNSLPDDLDCSSNQIKDAAMDAFIASLSQSNYGVLKIINSENEGNEMTKAQVDAAKAKGWTPSYRSGSVWMEYAGCDVAADVEINETNFPDANFRSYLLSEDYGSDGVITDAEIAEITSIVVDEKNIANLKGIEFFTALALLSCSNNQLTSLDVSNCVALKVLDLNDNQLSTLDVTKCKELKDLDLNGNQLTALDVSKNTALTSLYCGGNQLTALDVSKNTALTILNCGNNQLTALNVTKNTKLTDLSCYGNQLTALDVSKNTALISLYCYDNQLTTLNVSGCTALERLSCSNNQLTALDVSGCTALTLLSCNNNQLTKLDVSGCTALERLSCSNNQLTALDVSKNTALTRLLCANNQLTSLNVQSTALLRLDCSNNKLTSLIVSNSLPDDLDCSSNQIKDAAMDAFIASLSQSNYGVLKIINSENEGNEMTKAQVDAAKAKGWTPSYRSGSVWMEYAGCDAAAGVEINETNFPDANFRSYLLRQSYGSDGVLTDEEIAGITILAIRNRYIASLKGIEFFTSLTELRCNGNQLTSLDVSKNTVLNTLYCYNNQLTSLDVSKNTALSTLHCYINQLTALDVSKNTALTILNCGNNQLTALNVSKNTALTELDCQRNQLTALDVSKNTALTTLNCGGNQLTALDVTNNTALTYLDCFQNQIKGAAMDALVGSLPTRSYASLYVIYNENEGNVMTTTQVAAAKAKGWKPKYYDGTNWKEYAGSDPVVIEPIEEETTVSFGGTSGVDESTDLSNTAVNDVLYTLNNTAGNGYDNTDQSITITSVVSNANIAEAEALTPGTPEFAEKFNGITIELAAGQGSVTFDCQTIGNRQLTVKIGNAPAATYSKSERGEVKVAYNVAAPTFMYVYATAVAGARGSEPTTIENALKLYGFTVKPGDTTGINAINSDKALDGSDVYFDLSGRRVMAPQKGVYVKNGKKVVVK